MTLILNQVSQIHIITITMLSTTFIQAQLSYLNLLASTLLARAITLTSKIFHSKNPH